MIEEITIPIEPNMKMPDMSMMTWLATEGGRKCPMCGRYAKAHELGDLSFYARSTHSVARISSFGHLPGFGCNKPRPPITSDAIEAFLAKDRERKRIFYAANRERIRSHKQKMRAAGLWSS